MLLFLYFPHDLFVAHMNFLLPTGIEIEGKKEFRQYFLLEKIMFVGVDAELLAGRSKFRE